MNVALYIRVSTEEQAQGHSPDTQRTLLRQWAEQEGWLVAAEYEEMGVSAKNVDRPAFQQMVSEVDRFERVLVRERSRYARDYGDAIDDGQVVRRPRRVGLVAQRALHKR